jgi:hypothetical protein
VELIVVPGKFSHLLLILAATALLGVAISGCASREDAASDANSDDRVQDDSGPTVDDGAPDPEEVDANDLDIIEEWQEAGVPRFRDGEVLDFEPHASRIENGGTLLLDGVNASSDEIIAFYRGALTELGWTERRVGQREMTAESDVASLLVTVSEYDEQTLIMMILTDRMGQRSQN